MKNIPSRWKLTDEERKGAQKKLELLNRKYHCEQIDLPKYLNGLRRLTRIYGK